MSMPIAHMMSEPVIALARPPGLPGAGVVWVKMFASNPPMPFFSSE